MYLQKLILMLIMSVVLGQSVFASADVHLVFETTDKHHIQHDHDVGDLLDVEDHTGDDCGHCCHTHGCSVSMASHSPFIHLDSVIQLETRYLESPYSYYSDPALRPPIT